jgi:hypothetical protein
MSATPSSPSSFTSSGAPSTAGMPAGMPSGPTTGSDLTITPPAPARDMSRGPAPGPRPTSVWLGRDPMTGETISGEGDPFAQATQGEHKARPTGALYQPY